MEGLGEGKKWLGSQEKLTLRLPEKAEKELFLGGLERTEEETMMDRSGRVSNHQWNFPSKMQKFLSLTTPLISAIT